MHIYIFAQILLHIDHERPKLMSLFNIDCD